VSESPRLTSARNAYESAHDALIGALTTELNNQVLSSFPGAGWLIVDPQGWLDSPSFYGVRVRALVADDGRVLHQWTDGPPPEGLPPQAWSERVEELVTDIAEQDGTGGWPEVCDPTGRGCQLRSVGLTPVTEPTTCIFPHHHDGSDGEESAGDLLVEALQEAGHQARTYRAEHSGAESVVVTAPGGEVWISDGAGGIHHSPNEHLGWYAEFYADPSLTGEAGLDLHPHHQDDFTADTALLIAEVTAFIRSGSAA
jgi:hypothetical protein